VLSGQGKGLPLLPFMNKFRTLNWSKIAYSGNIFELVRLNIYEK